VLIKRLKPFSLVFCLAIVTGCVDIAAQMTEIAEEDRIANQQILLSMGERTLDVDKINLMKAFVTAFSNKNISVASMDKELGYLMAEGSGFLSPEKYKEVGMANVDRMNERTTGIKFKFVSGNNILRFNVNLFEKGENRTTAKVGVSSKTLGEQEVKVHELPPIMLTAIYEELWRELDKALFIQRATE